MKGDVIPVDVIIIGGGPAGLSAALVSGRSRRRAVVLDGGSPRHGVAEGVHNFVTRDGISPADFRAEAWAQMAAYPTVEQVAGVFVEGLRWENERWIAEAADGRRWAGRAALLAMGVVDEHPPIPGYPEKWGHAIHHCPFCHGWEMQDRPLGILAGGDAAAHLAPLLKGWSDDVAVLTNGEPIDPTLRETLKALGISVYTQPIAALEGPGRDLEAVRFEDGARLPRQGLFVVAPQHQVPLVQSLDLALSEDGSVGVDAMGRTSLPMLWAAGDMTSRFRQAVVSAAAQGMMAGAMIHGALTPGLHMGGHG